MTNKKISRTEAIVQLLNTGFFFFLDVLNTGLITLKSEKHILSQAVTSKQALPIIYFERNMKYKP